MITGDLFKLVHLGTPSTIPPRATSGSGHWNWSTYSFQAGGTHPTGMLSCLCIIFTVIFPRFRFNADFRNEVRDAWGRGRSAHGARPPGRTTAEWWRGLTVQQPTGANPHPHNHPQHPPPQQHPVPPPQHPGSNLSSPHPAVSTAGPGPGGAGGGDGTPAGSLAGTAPLHPPAHSHSGPPQRFPDPRQPYNPEQIAAVLPLMDPFNAIHNLQNYYYWYGMLTRSRNKALVFMYLFPGRPRPFYSQISGRKNNGRPTNVLL